MGPDRRSSRWGGRGKRIRYVSTLLLLACCPLALILDTFSHFREASRVQVAETLLLSLHSAPIPMPGRPDVAVHLPAGFDPARRPLVALYFHGWNGCVEIAVGDEDGPCVEDGPARQASHLASELDASGVNALLVAIELRRDAPSGEVGPLAEPGRLRILLGELFERLTPRLGMRMDLDASGGIIVVAHSGGYQAAAAALRSSNLPLREVALFDALYGADSVFDDALLDRSLRVVNLYTYNGGTRERSLRLAERARGVGRDVVAGDEDGAMGTDTFAHDVVIERVPVAHADVPRTYTRAVLQGLLEIH